MVLSSVTVGMRVNYDSKNGEVKRTSVMGVDGTEVLYDDNSSVCYVGTKNTLFKQNAVAL